jgi:hypothetical protein
MNPEYNLKLQTLKLQTRVWFVPHCLDLFAYGGSDFRGAGISISDNIGIDDKMAVVYV